MGEGKAYALLVIGAVAVNLGVYLLFPGFYSKNNKLRIQWERDHQRLKFSRK